MAIGGRAAGNGGRWRQRRQRRDGVRAECGGAHASMLPVQTFRSRPPAQTFRSRPPVPTSRSHPPAPTSRSRSPTAATLRSRLPHAHMCSCAWAQCAVSMGADCERRRRRHGRGKEASCLWRCILSKRVEQQRWLNGWRRCKLPKASASGCTNEGSIAPIVKPCTGEDGDPALPTCSAGGCVQLPALP